MGDTSQQLIEINADGSNSEQILGLLQVQGNEGSGGDGVPIQLVTTGSGDGQEALLLQSAIEVNGERHVILQQAQDPNTGEVLVFLQGENGETVCLPPEALNANFVQMGDGGGQVYTLALPQDADGSSVVVVSGSPDGMDGATMVTNEEAATILSSEANTTTTVSGDVTETVTECISSTEENVNIPLQQSAGTNEQHLIVSIADTTSTHVVQSVDTPLMATSQDITNSIQSSMTTQDSNAENQKDSNVTMASSIDINAIIADNNEKTEDNEIIENESKTDSDVSKMDQIENMNYGSAVIQVQDANSTASLDSLVANAMVTAGDNYVIMTTNDEGGLPKEINLADVINAGSASGQTIFLQTSEGLVACQAATTTEDGSLQIVADSSGNPSAMQITTTSDIISEDQLVQGQTVAYSLTSTSSGIELTPVTNVVSASTASNKNQHTITSASRARPTRQTKSRSITIATPTTPATMGETLLLPSKTLVSTPSISLQSTVSSARKRIVTSRSRSNINVSITPSSSSYSSSSPVIPVQPDSIHASSSDFTTLNKSSSSDVIDASLLTEGVQGPSKLAASRRTYSKKSNIVWLNPELTNSSSKSSEGAQSALDAKFSKILDESKITLPSDDNKDSPSTAITKQTSKPTTLAVTSPITVTSVPTLRSPKKSTEPSTNAEVVSPSKKVKSTVSSPISCVDITKALEEKSELSVASPIRKVTAVPQVSSGRIVTSPVKISSPVKPGSPNKITSPTKPASKPGSPVKMQDPSSYGSDFTLSDLEAIESVQTPASPSKSPDKNIKQSEETLTNHESVSSPKSKTQITIGSPTGKKITSPDTKIDSVSPLKTRSASNEASKTSSISSPKLASPSVSKTSAQSPTKSDSKSKNDQKLNYDSKDNDAAPSNGSTGKIISKTTSVNQSESEQNQSAGKTISKADAKAPKSPTKTPDKSSNEVKEETQPAKDVANKIGVSEKTENLVTRAKRRTRGDISSPERETKVQSEGNNEKSEDIKESSKVDDKEKIKEPVTPAPRGRGRPPKSDTPREPTRESARKKKKDEASTEISEIRESKRLSSRVKDAKITSEAESESSSNEKETSLPQPSEEQRQVPAPPKKRIIASESKKETTIVEVAESNDSDSKTAETRPTRASMPSKSKSDKEIPNIESKVTRRSLQAKETESKKKDGEEALKNEKQTDNDHQVSKTDVSEVKEGHGTRGRRKSLAIKETSSNKTQPAVENSDNLKEEKSSRLNRESSKESTKAVEETPKTRGRKRKTVEPVTTTSMNDDGKTEEENAADTSLSKKKVCFSLDAADELDDDIMSPLVIDDKTKEKRQVGRKKIVNKPIESPRPTPILKPSKQVNSCKETVIVNFGSVLDSKTENEEKHKSITALKETRGPSEYFDFLNNDCYFHIRHQSSNLTSKRPIECEGNYICQKCGFKTSRMNNLVHHHKDQCSVIKMAWQNEINKQTQKTYGRTASSYLHNISSKRRRLDDELSSPMQDDHDSMDSESETETLPDPEQSRALIGLTLQRTLDSSNAHHSDGEDHQDAKESFKKKYGFKANEIVWTDWSDVHWPALVLEVDDEEKTVTLKMIDNPSNRNSLTVSIDKVYTFNDAEKNKRYLSEGKSITGDSIVRAVQKAEDYSRKRCLGDEIGAAKLLGTLDSHFNISSEEDNLNDDRQDDYDNHKDDQKSDPQYNKYGSGGIDSDPNDDYLDFQSSETIAQLKERRKTQNAKLLECIKEGKVESHLLGVYKETINSDRHKKYTSGSNAEKSSLKHVPWFGPFDDEEQQEEIYDYCSQLFKSNFRADLSFDVVAYLFEVWVPEAIVKAIAKTRMVDMIEAEAIFAKGVILSKSEKDELEKEIMKETEKQNSNQEQNDKSAKKEPLIETEAKTELESETAVPEPEKEPETASSSISEPVLVETALAFEEPTATVESPNQEQEQTN